LPSPACGGGRAGAKQNPFRLTPLLAALLLAYPAMQARHAQAEEASPGTLPFLGQRNDRPAALGASTTGLVVTAGYTLNTSTAPSPLTGLWWNPEESGWGLSLSQQGPIIFVAWYTYN